MMETQRRKKKEAQRVFSARHGPSLMQVDVRGKRPSLLKNAQQSLWEKMNEKSFSLILVEQKQRKQGKDEGRMK